MNITGWKTVIVGALMAVTPAALQYLAGVNWANIVSPAVAAFIYGGIMIAMRFVSTTSIFKPTPVPAVVSMSDAELHKAGIAKILTAANPVGRELAEKTNGVVVAQVTNPSASAGVGRRAS